MRRGITTDVLKSKGSKKKEDFYFSIIGGARTIDLEAESEEMREFLVTRLTILFIDLNEDKAWLEKVYEDDDDEEYDEDEEKDAPPPPMPPPPSS